MYLLCIGIYKIVLNICMCVCVSVCVCVCVCVCARACVRIVEFYCKYVLYALGLF